MSLKKDLIDKQARFWVFDGRRFDVDWGQWDWRTELSGTDTSAVGSQLRSGSGER